MVAYSSLCQNFASETIGACLRTASCTVGRLTDRNPKAGSENSRRARWDLHGPADTGQFLCDILRVLLRSPSKGPLAVLVVIDNDFPPGFWARYRSMVIMA
jgi:hypothetical protein